MNIVELGIKPVSDSSRCGNDCKYDVEFESLDLEISKLTSFDQSSSVNWNKVNTLCIEILDKKSKHLSVAVYLFYAELKLKNLSSLSYTVPFFGNFLNNFWDEMFPPLKRLAGRKNITDWWIEKTSEFIKNAKEEYLSDEDCAKIIDGFSLIDSIIADKLPDCTSLLPTIKELEYKIVKPKESEKQNIVHANSSTVQNNNDTSFAIDLSKPTNEIIADVLKLSDSALSILLQDGFLHDSIFKISRLHVWSDIEDLPLNNGLVTYIQPFDDDIESAIVNLIAKGNFKDALLVVESRFYEKPLWLDLQKYAFDCLNELGEKHIAEYIKFETRMLLMRLNGLEELKFNNTKAFASQETKRWLLENIDSQCNNQNSTPDRQDEPCSVISELITNKNITDAIKKSIDYLSSNIALSSKFKMYALLLEALDLLNNKVIFESYAAKACNEIEAQSAISWVPKDVIAIYVLILNSKFIDTGFNTLNIEKIKMSYAMLDPIKASTLV